METRFLGRQKSLILVYIFLCNSGMLDMTEALRKFYSSFNNIMPIIGKQSNEMVAVHLAKMNVGLTFLFDMMFF